MEHKEHQTEDAYSTSDDRLQPVKHAFIQSLKHCCIFVIGGGITVVLLSSVCLPTHGASRSATLQFSERQAEIDLVVQDKDTDHCEPAAQ